MGNDISRHTGSSQKSRKLSTARCAAFFLVTGGLALILSCAEDPKKAAERERIAALRSRKAELSAALTQATGEAAIEKLRALIELDAMKLGDPDSALALYEEHEELLSQDMESRVLVATAQAMKAGIEKKIEDKLKWLMRGMATFEELREEFPDELSVILYQASTYANFPPEVGAAEEVLSLLSIIRERCASGFWPMDEGIASQISYTYAALMANISDEPVKTAALDQQRSFANAFPAYAAFIAPEME